MFAITSSPTFVPAGGRRDQAAHGGWHEPESRRDAPASLHHLALSDRWWEVGGGRLEVGGWRLGVKVGRLEVRCQGISMYVLRLGVKVGISMYASRLDVKVGISMCVSRLVKLIDVSSFSPTLEHPPQVGRVIVCLVAINVIDIPGSYITWRRFKKGFSHQ